MRYQLLSPKMSNTCAELTDKSALIIEVMSDVELAQLQNYFQYSAYRDTINSNAAINSNDAVILERTPTPNTAKTSISDTESDIRILTGNELAQLQDSILYLTAREDANAAIIKGKY